MVNVNNWEGMDFRFKLAEDGWLSVRVHTDDTVLLGKSGCKAQTIVNELKDGWVSGVREME